MTNTKKSKTQVKVKSYTRKDGTRVRSSQRSIETNNIRNTQELTRPRKRKELLKDIGSAITLGIFKPSELTRKRDYLYKASLSRHFLDSVTPKGLAEATKIATNNYQINPNSKKALAEINKLENRARIAGLTPEIYKREAKDYEKYMEKAGYQGMKYRGTDFSSSTTNQIEFKRGKDKKKRKRKSRRNEAIIAAASIGGGARIGGIHGFIRGRGGLGGRKTIAERAAKVSGVTANQIKNTPGFDLNTAGKSLNKRGRKMAMKHAAIGAGIGAASYGGYRAIKALRNRKKK